MAHITITPMTTIIMTTMTIMTIITVLTRITSITGIAASIVIISFWGLGSRWLLGKVCTLNGLRLRLEESELKAYGLGHSQP